MTIDATTNGGAQSSHGQGNNAGEENFAIKAGLAQMLKGGVIMDVVNAEQVRLLLPLCFHYLSPCPKEMATDMACFKGTAG